jgi:hypothetical protein
MEFIRDLTIDKMCESFSKRPITQREKIDTTSLYKKLEVELINSRNAKLEIEKDLLKEKAQVQQLTIANSQWSEYTKDYFKKIVGVSLVAGVCVGAIIGYFGIR